MSEPEYETKRYFWSPEYRDKFALSNSDDWTYELKTPDSENPVMSFGKAIRKYVATGQPEPNLTPAGKPCKFRDGRTKPPIVREFILDSVTDVCKQIGGTSDGLLDWAVTQTMLDMLAQCMPGMDYGDHLKNLTFLTRRFEDAVEEARLAKTERPKMSEIARYAISEMQREPRFEISMSQMALMLDRAAPARKRRLELEGEYGTRTHELIEIYVSNGCLQFTGPDGNLYELDIKEEAPEVQRAFATFLEFYKGLGLKPIASELMVADIEQGVAGTLDHICEDPEESLILLDWKTSKKVRDHFLLQVTAYAALFCRENLNALRTEKCQICSYDGNAEILKPVENWPTKAFIVRFDKLKADLQIVEVWSTREEYLSLCRQWVNQMETHRWIKWAVRYIGKFSNERIDDAQADSEATPQELSEGEIEKMFAAFGEPF